MAAGSTQENVDKVQRRIEARGLTAAISYGVDRAVVGVLGSIPQDFKDELELLPGVMQGLVVSKPYKLASRESTPIRPLSGWERRWSAATIQLSWPGPARWRTKSRMVSTAKAVKTAGAHGLLIEVHPNPDVAKCDGLSP